MLDAIVQRTRQAPPMQLCHQTLVLLLVLPKGWAQEFLHAYLSAARRQRSLLISLQQGEGLLRQQRLDVGTPARVVARLTALGRASHGERPQQQRTKGNLRANGGRTSNALRGNVEAGQRSKSNGVKHLKFCSSGQAASKVQSSARLSN